MKHKQMCKIGIAVVVTLTAACLTFALLLRARTIDVTPFDLNTVEDGTYVGVCQNKILVAVVQVEVADHKMIAIDILQHKEAYMPQADKIANRVLAQQSLTVDAVAGATLTSDTVLKAVKDALLKGVHNNESR